MRVNLELFDLGVDREIETLDYYIEFNSDHIIISTHCNTKRHPDPNAGEIFEPKARFISSEQFMLRECLTGVEVYWSVWEEKGVDIDEYSCWIIEFYGDGATSHVKVRFKKEKEARRFYKVAKDYLLKKFIH